MYKAEIKTVVKLTDSVAYTVLYANDAGDSFTKDYNFVMVNDIITSLDETILSELKRLNDLETMFTEINSKVGKKYEITP
jgi:hypothetical protein